MLRKSEDHSRISVISNVFISICAGDRHTDRISVKIIILISVSIFIPFSLSYNSPAFLCGCKGICICSRKSGICQHSCRYIRGIIQISICIFKGIFNAFKACGVEIRTFNILSYLKCKAESFCFSRGCCLFTKGSQ